MASRTVFPRSVSGVLSAAGASASSFSAQGTFNLSLWGTFSATMVLERTFDGVTWLPYTYVDGTPLVFRLPVSTTIDEPEEGIRYRLRCTSYTSGTVNWRMSH